MNVLHIASRELRATFSTATGWLVTCSWLLLSGIFWMLMLDNYVTQSQNLVFDPYAASQLTLNDYLLGPWFGNCAVVMVMFVPALTMRLFSEEVRQRTLELLLTSPVSSAEIVLGKFLGAAVVVWGLVLSTAYGPLLLFRWGSPDPGVIFTGYFGLVLLGATLVAIGTLASAMNSSQVAAGITAFAAALALLVVEWRSSSPDDVYAHLALLGHLNDLFRGAVRLSDVVYYLAFTGLLLFATHQRMESFRWK